MAIDAMVGFVETFEHGGGVLHLAEPRPGAIVGQNALKFDDAPHEVTALNGLPIWGGAGEIMLGQKRIARREGYTRIVFVEREDFLAAVQAWHEADRKQES